MEADLQIEHPCVARSHLLSARRPVGRIFERRASGLLERAASQFERARDCEESVVAMSDSREKGWMDLTAPQIRAARLHSDGQALE